MKRGWWTLEIRAIDDSFNESLTDEDREHIARMIREGCTSGELIQED